MDEQNTTQTGDEGDGDGSEGLDTTTTVDGGGDGGQSPVAQQTQQAPRTFTQEQVNAYIAGERRKWQAQQQRVTQDRTPPIRETPAPTKPFDPETQEALRAYLDPLITPLREQAIAGEIERAQQSVTAKHPELADKANMDAVINLVLTWGEDIVNRAPMNWLLEQGYNAWRYGTFDEKAHNAKVISDYVASKARKAGETPPPQGGGGRATTSKKASPKDWKGADAAMKDLIAEAQSNQ